MKKLKLMIVLAVLAFGISAHAEKVTAGPKGGRILETSEPKAEFFVEKDHMATVTFYGADMKPVPVAEQSVTMIADAKDGKQKIEFEKKGDALVSKSRLPNVENGNVVVQLRQQPDARPQNFRFKVNMETCGGCKRAEYACTCDE